jgi:adenylate cyclase
VRITGGLQRQFQLAEPVRIGVGINTGMASVGNIGSIAASDYTALGDVVNKAFRLESATRAAGCDLLIGKDAKMWLGKIDGLESLFEPCTVTLKGYAEPVTAYRGSIADVEAFLAARATEAAG